MIAVTPLIRVGNPLGHLGIHRFRAAPVMLLLRDFGYSTRSSAAGRFQAARCSEDTWDFVNAGETESW